MSYISRVLNHVQKGIITKELRLNLFFVNMSDHKRWAYIRKLSSHAPSPETTRMALLMVRRLLFFSGPLGTRQWNHAKLGKLSPAWFMAIAISLFPHFHKHQLLLENLGEICQSWAILGFLHHLLTFDLTSQITKWKMGSTVLTMITNQNKQPREEKQKSHGTPT